MELLDTKSGLEGQGSKVNSEPHGKRGKCGKMKLLDIKTGLEGQGSKVKSEQHGKRGKDGTRDCERSISSFSILSMLFRLHFRTLLLEPGFGVRELHFSRLSTLSRVFGVHF